jgi:hypothetical protein
MSKKYPTAWRILEEISVMSEQEKAWLASHLSVPGFLGEGWFVLSFERYARMMLKRIRAESRARRLAEQLEPHTAGPAAKKAQVARRWEEIEKLWAAMGGREVVQALAASSGKEESKYIFDYLFGLDPGLVKKGRGVIDHKHMLTNRPRPKPRA